MGVQKKIGAPLRRHRQSVSISIGLWKWDPARFRDRELEDSFVLPQFLEDTLLAVEFHNTSSLHLISSLSYRVSHYSPVLQTFLPSADATTELDHDQHHQILIVINNQHDAITLFHCNRYRWNLQSSLPDHFLIYGWRPCIAIRLPTLLL